MKDLSDIGLGAWIMLMGVALIVAFGTMRGRPLRLRRWGGMEILGLALTLLLCTLIVERSVEVYSLTLRARNESQRTRDIDKVKWEIGYLEDREVWVRKWGEPFFDDGRSGQDLESELQLIEKEQAEWRKEMPKAIANWHRYEGRTARRRVLLALLLGALISSLGVRTLAHLFEKEEVEGLEGKARPIFHAADITLTAGLFAGGSEVIRRLFLLLADAPHKM